MLLVDKKFTSIFNCVLIETHNRCNRKCVFCKFGQPRSSEPKSVMHWDVLAKVVDDLVALGYKNRISWVGINEPLLDKRLSEFVSYVKERLPDVFQSTITNGDALSPTLYEKLRACGMDTVAVSVYDENALHKAQGLARTHPEIRVWDQRRYSDLKWAVAESKDFTNRAGGLDVPVDLPDMRNVRCMKPFTGISVVPSGDVPLCSDDMYGDVIMGNVLKESLADIWFGEKFEKYRLKLRHKRHGLPLCDGCTNKGGPHSVRFP